MGKHQGKILSVCDYCGAENSQYVSLYKLSKRHFCNRKCYGLKLLKKGHPRYGKGMPAEEVKLRRKAVSDAGHAITSKKLIRKPCEVCGEEKVHGHHDDYSKPLEVRWLCFKHHMELHGRSVAG